MKRYLTFIILACGFIALSALLYFVHYAIFHDVHHIFIYMVGDLAFLPLEVFLVVIVIERVLARREKQAVMQKLNMVVGDLPLDRLKILSKLLLQDFTQGTKQAQAVDFCRTVGRHFME